MPERLTDEPLPLNQGGLFRCCIDAYMRFAPPADETQEGQILACPGCQGIMEVANGEWRWQAPIS